MVRLVAFVAVVMLLGGCATLTGRPRVLTGMSIGAGIGAGGGAIFSPNTESRGLNALVFGLSGALLGGVISYVSDPSDAIEKHASDLKARELGATPSGRDFVVLPEPSLPEFVRKRMQPVVIEEFVERDHVSEEGTLHEPHKAYRIKRPAELFAQPALESQAKDFTPVGGK